MQARFTVIQDFVNSVRQECVINQNYFNFHDIPDHILKQGYQRKDYDDVIKILLKVKAKYLADKAIQNPDKPKEEIQVITDFDLIPLDLFEMILAQFQNKQNEKKQTVLSYISELHSIVAKIVANLDSSANDKTKKNVE